MSRPTQMGRRSRTRPPALLVEPAERNQLDPKTKPEESGAVLSCICKTKGCGVLVKLGLKTTIKGIFCETFEALLGEKALVSSLQSTAL